MTAINAAYLGKNTVSPADVSTAIANALAGLPAGVSMADVAAAIQAAIAALPPDQVGFNPTGAPETTNDAGDSIGTQPDGNYVDPDIVGTFPITVNGVKYRIPLVAG